MAFGVFPCPNLGRRVDIFDIHMWDFRPKTMAKFAALIGAVAIIAAAGIMIPYAIFFIGFGAFVAIIRSEDPFFDYGVPLLFILAMIGATIKYHPFITLSIITTIITIGAYVTVS